MARRLSYSARKYPMTDAARAWLKQAILDVVYQAYSNWAALNESHREVAKKWGTSPMRAPEPKLSVGFLRDLLPLRHSRLDELIMPPTRIIDGRVRAAADALVADEYLARSTGLSHSGQEAKMYEPGPKMEY